MATSHETVVLVAGNEQSCPFFVELGEKGHSNHLDRPPAHTLTWWQFFKAHTVEFVLQQTPILIAHVFPTLGQRFFESGSAMSDADHMAL